MVKARARSFIWKWIWRFRERMGIEALKNLLKMVGDMQCSASKSISKKVFKFLKKSLMMFGRFMGIWLGRGI